MNRAQYVAWTKLLEDLHQTLLDIQKIMTRMDGRLRDIKKVVEPPGPPAELPDSPIPERRG